MNERKSEQAHIFHAPTLLDITAHNEWQRQCISDGAIRQKSKSNIGNKRIHISSILCGVSTQFKFNPTYHVTE